MIVIEYCTILHEDDWCYLKNPSSLERLSKVDYKFDLQHSLLGGLCNISYHACQHGGDDSCIPGNHYDFSWLKGSCPFPRGDHYEIVEIQCWNFKIFSRTTGPISTKLATKRPWVVGIQVCSNDGPCPFLRGYYYEIVKVHWPYIKIFSRIQDQS